MRIRPSFMREIERFDRVNRQPGSPEKSDAGIRQFFELESRGIRPESPDPYFTHLCNGKAWWEWSVNQYAELYLTDDWPGWSQVEADFAGDERGLKQVRRRCGVAG
jgi:hypothetical protein